ncbi:four-carbon acid sugar kinase family protein [Paenibacillus periandrae]|uniref:four-carbon acid sugar kinase family protein n=1 Tax=Paenibacillus periandrae TaxID=1761741 RepID=UPI001F08DA13|nr:four-carbon acid sugar kinase family protein [Paenibacillus periandrae]
MQTNNNERKAGQAQSECLNVQSTMDVEPIPSRSQVKRLLCYYGDDFTGSTDVLESLFHAGLSTVLFLEPPTETMLSEQFRNVQCFGVAGVGRSLSPDAMDRELRPLLETLKTAGAAITHYKICSTFDSSPHTGSIGKAAEIGKAVFGSRYIPLLAGVPYLRRYTIFGNHFAAAGDTVHRLDRHPTMSQHPVTPMAEADLIKHLQKQTLLKTSLFDLLALDGIYEKVEQRLHNLVHNEQPDLVLFDVLDEPRLETAGRLIWAEAAEADDGLFVIGSSGVEYALGACWQADGLTAALIRKHEAAGKVEQLLVVSGSCSPVTEKQIRVAMEAGFVGIQVPVHDLIQTERTAEALAKLEYEAQQAISEGKSMILYTAAGPSDSSIAMIREALMKQGLKADDSSRLLGNALGVLTRRLIAELGLSRILIAGGDTSGYITRELGIYALECKALLDPGAPLCIAYSHDPQFDGLELVLKGGQVGGEHFFEKVRQGSS